MSNNSGKSNEDMFSKENIQERGTSSTQYSSQIVGNIPCGRLQDATEFPLKCFIHR